LPLNNLVNIEHIGSTAIPDIDAKPVIDILIGVKEIDVFSSEDIRHIESLGYRYNAVFETICPHRRYFQKDDIHGNRTHQIHVVSYPFPWYEKHILFRDYLCVNPSIAKEYEHLKRQLAAQFDDTVPYANAKNEFCQAIDKMAFCNFKINKPLIETERLIAFIPQLACHEAYAHMLSNAEFIKCYGVSYNHEEAFARLESDITHYNQYAFAPWMWYDKLTHAYVGRGGFKRFVFNEQSEVELTYQIERAYWGKGIALEIGQAAIDYAVQHLSFKKPICFTAHNNHQSLQVIRKLGFAFENDFEHAGVTHKLHSRTL
jgi:GrpB-like predicted nucleotidyltransferase (UPF0157 family)/RimJ/RimL family protein N-acetyltransferase